MPGHCKPPQVVPASLSVWPLRRCRLACVSRAFQAFCEQHATKRKRQHTEVVVPMKNWEAYVDGISRWLGWHSTALRAVRVQFEVRRWLSQVALAREAQPVMPLLL